MGEEQIPVLDYGYVQLIETWGSDERIIESARMSTGKGFKGWGLSCDCGIPPVLPGQPVPPCPAHENGSHDYKPGDEKLLNFLWTMKHGTPFEMAGMVVEVKAPIFVYREWHRHRTQSYNEMSARYTPLPDENYIPTVERLMINSKTNKQAGTVAGAEELTEEGAKKFIDGLKNIYFQAQCLYELALKMGVPKELARIHLPVGRYSRMRASANLRNWLAFLTLRMDKAAQWEIRQYANVVGELIKKAFPRTWEVYCG